MKATAKVIELDGTADEIASVLAGVMGTTVTLEAGTHTTSLTDTPNPAPPTPPPAPPTAVVVVDEPARAEVVPMGTPVIPSRRYREWQDVPAELRVWNAMGTVAHIAKSPNDPYTTWCGHDVGQVRPADLEPRSVATPCGNCNRRIDEAARKECAA